MNSNDIVVVCPIKNNNEYLIEFVEHYIKIGFDKIYLYDNNDDDLINPKDILQKYILNGVVKIINYRNSVFVDTVQRNHFYSYADFEWVFFADDDEFLELNKHKNINDFLASFDRNVKKIAINNLHFGDNNRCYYEQGYVQSLFKDPLPIDIGNEKYKFNSAIKSILKKVKGNYELNAHSLINDHPYYNAENKTIKLRSFWNTFDDDISYDTAYIKHYCTKSLEEFIKCKVKRVQRNNLKFMNERYNINNYYFMYNKRTREKEELVDFFIKKYL